jgi:ribonuclease D
MADPTMPPPILVQTAEDMAKMVRRFQRQPRLAIDTESNSLFAYQERVCLIQFSIPGADYLVDPLSLDDLSALDPLLRDGSIEKVLHGAEYDVLCLARDFNFRLHNLFDTRAGSRMLGWTKSGLGDLIELVFGVKVDKRFQRADWGKRPLGQEMLDYARLDTHFLLPLRDRLAKELKENELWVECHEFCEHMTKPPAWDNGFDPLGFWRISNARDLSRRQLAILRELYLFRDQEARRLDRPPFKIMGDHVLLAIARAEPGDGAALSEIKDAPKKITQRYSSKILKAVVRGGKAPPPRRPRNRGMDEEAQTRFEALRDWRKKVARKRKLESDLILPRDLMLSLAKEPPRDLGQLEGRMEPLEWRFRHYGKDILTTLSNS